MYTCNQISVEAYNPNLPRYLLYRVLEPLGPYTVGTWEVKVITYNAVTECGVETWLLDRTVLKVWRQQAHLSVSKQGLNQQDKLAVGLCSMSLERVLKGLGGESGRMVGYAFAADTFHVNRLQYENKTAFLPRLSN